MIPDTEELKLLASFIIIIVIIIIIIILSIIPPRLITDGSCYRLINAPVIAYSPHH